MMNQTMHALGILEKSLGYVFTDQKLLKRALRHRSCGSDSNERLEFLGDSIVNFLISETIFSRFQHLPEGVLSRMRAQLVRSESLTHIAQTLTLERYIQVADGERRSGGQRRPSILADAVEALAGAIFLDGGMEHVKRCVLMWYAPLLSGLRDDDTFKDAKTALQEWAQGRGFPLPRYEEVAVTGKEHAQAFHIRCTISGVSQFGEGRGMSKRAAAQAAAQALLDQCVPSQK